MGTLSARLMFGGEGSRSSMKIGEIMTLNVQTVAPDDSLQTAAGVMRDNGVGVLHVCEGGRLVGVITDRDITVRAVAEGEPSSGCMVHEVITEHVNYAFADDDLGDVARKMVEWQVNRFPIFSREKELVGIVSLVDVALETMQATARPSAQHQQQQPGSPK